LETVPIVRRLQHLLVVRFRDDVLPLPRWRLFDACNRIAFDQLLLQGPIQGPLNGGDRPAFHATVPSCVTIGPLRPMKRPQLVDRHPDRHRFEKRLDAFEIPIVRAGRSMLLSPIEECVHDDSRAVALTAWGLRINS
jgi:hypothetical protein